MKKENKLEKILSLNVNGYFEWMDRIMIEEIPFNGIENAKELKGKIINKEYSDVPQLEKVYKGWVELMENKKTEKNPEKEHWRKATKEHLMKDFDYEILKKGVTENLESSKKEFEKRKAVGRRIEDEMNQYVKLVDKRMIYQVTMLQPLVDGLCMEYLTFFCNILYIQYLHLLKEESKVKSKLPKDVLGFSISKRVMLLQKLGGFHLFNKAAKPSHKARIIMQLLNVSYFELNKIINMLDSGNGTRDNKNPYIHEKEIDEFLEKFAPYLKNKN